MIPPVTHQRSSFEGEVFSEPGPSDRPSSYFSSSLSAMEPREYLSMRRQQASLEEMIYWLSSSESEMTTILINIKLLPVTRELCIRDFDLNNFLHHTSEIKEETESIIKRFVENATFLRDQAIVWEERLSQVIKFVSKLHVLSQQILEYEKARLSPEEHVRLSPKGLEQVYTDMTSYLKHIQSQLDIAEPDSKEQEPDWHEIILSDLRGLLEELEAKAGVIDSQKVAGGGGIVGGGALCILSWKGAVPLGILIGVNPLAVVIGTFAAGVVLVSYSTYQFKEASERRKALPFLSEYKDVYETTLKKLEDSIDDLNEKKRALEQFSDNYPSFIKTLSLYIKSELEGFEEGFSRQNWDVRIANWEKIGAACKSLLKRFGF